MASLRSPSTSMLAGRCGSLLRPLPLLLGAMIALHCHKGAATNLHLAHSWKLLTYKFAPNAPVEDLKFYNPLNVIVTGIAISDDRIFIATPQLFAGVPASLSFIWKQDLHRSPQLQPYPNWSYAANNGKTVNCKANSIISVYRVRIDSCHRLWVVDTGVARSFEDAARVCAPKILIFDLRTNQVVQRIDLPKDVLRRNSLLTNIIIDETTATRCSDAFAYMADTVEPGLVVYDGVRNAIWRVTHSSMDPNPDLAEIRILKDRFQLMDGVVGMAFDPKLRKLYYQAVASQHIYSISTHLLRNGPSLPSESLAVHDVYEKTSQGMGIAVSPLDGSIIFSAMTETSISSLDPRSDIRVTLASDRERLQFVADIVSTPDEDDVLYVLSSRFHRYFLKNLNIFDTNTRILRLRLPAKAKTRTTMAPRQYSTSSKYSTSRQYTSPRNSTQAYGDIKFYYLYE